MRGSLALRLPPSGASAPNMGAAVSLVVGVAEAWECHKAPEDKKKKEMSSQSLQPPQDKQEAPKGHARMSRVVPLGGRGLGEADKKKR